MLQKMGVDQREIVFLWVPGHVDIRGWRLLIEALEALDKESIDDLVLFSNSKPLTAKCMH